MDTNPSFLVSMLNFGGVPLAIYNHKATQPLLRPAAACMGQIHRIHTVGNAILKGPRPSEVVSPLFPATALLGFHESTIYIYTYIYIHTYYAYHICHKSCSIK